MLRTDRRTDGRTDRRTDRPKPIWPLNFFEVGGIKTVIVVKVERYGCTLPECIQKGGDEMANGVDPDQTAPRSSLFWVCTVCSDLSVPILRTFTVVLVICIHSALLSQILLS